jgi:hypothetical protein
VLEGDRVSARIPDLGNQFLGGRLALVVDDGNFGTFGSERFRDRSADASARARHQRYLAR